ncbi:MAG: TIM-barrel domain-containing protein [Rhodanobacter sp.]
MQLTSSRESVRIVFCGSGVVHVVATPAGAPDHATWPQPWIATPCTPARSSLKTTAETATLSTAEMSVSVDLASGALSFEDASGNVLLKENKLKPRRYRPVDVAGQRFYAVSDQFYPTMAEGIYGLGQHQDGVFNYRGALVDLSQTNSNIAVPLLLSTNGYGLLWNTAARSQLDDRFSREMTFSSSVAAGVDYFFFHGPSMDTIIHHYRDLTGHAPLFGQWAYGFIQSKDKYTSAKQLLDVAAEYRNQHVPLDVIVQDWFWWKKQGDPEFSADYLTPYPDVPKALRKLHDEHVHAILSIWSVLDPASDNYRDMLAQHLLIPGMPDYDPTNPKARDFYWNHLISKLFAQGWDGFWLDSSEPESWGGEVNDVLEDKRLHIGPGALYANLFPLMHTGNVYDHWRQATSKKRAFLLTRSAFAGQQRNATVEWSGDIFGTFPVLRRQIAAGLNFALSGMPYWTTDIGGYTTPWGDDAPANQQYQELYTRWYEFGTFCPILRTHGHRSSNELFSYGAQTPTLIAYDKLRSRLQPYIYSLAWRVTHDDDTIMRPLVMDWPEDVRVRDIDDQFMFGPALLVNPVTVAGATQRLLYLPPAKVWYDFWTGARLKGDQQILAQAPLDRIPLYVPAGTILPLGPPVEYAGQQPDSAIELRIYPGAEGSFTLYQDAGDGYQYETGAHATIALHWNDSTSTLAIEQRVGSYAHMPKKLLFHITLVSPHDGIGFDASKAFTTVTYLGKPVAIRLGHLARQD